MRSEVTRRGREGEEEGKRERLLSTWIHLLNCLVSNAQLINLTTSTKNVNAALRGTVAISLESLCFLILFLSQHYFSMNFYFELRTSSTRRKYFCFINSKKQERCICVYKLAPFIFLCFSLCPKMLSLCQLEKIMSGHCNRCSIFFCLLSQV